MRQPMITGTLSRYFGMRFLTSVVGSFIGVVALAAMIDYVELMRRGADWPNATAWVLAKISMYRVPQLTERIMPFSVLVGAMSCYLTLSRRLELVVARAGRHFRLAIRGAGHDRGLPLRHRRHHRLQSRCRHAARAIEASRSRHARARTCRRCRKAPADSGSARKAPTARPSSMPAPAASKARSSAASPSTPSIATGTSSSGSRRKAPRWSRAIGSSRMPASMPAARRRTSRTAIASPPI